MTAATDLVCEAEKRLAEGFDDDFRIYEAAKQTAKEVREAWESEVKAAVKAGEASPLLPAAAAMPDEPVRPRVRVVNATTEKLAALAAALPRGLLQVRDEIFGWIGSFDKYGGGGADRAFAVEMYGGRHYIVDRVKNAKPTVIPRLSIGVLGGAQPDKLQALIEGPDDGLLSRFLLAWPDILPEFTLARTAPDDADARAAFVRLADLPMGSDDDGRPVPKRLRLTRDAEDLIEEFGRKTTRRAHEASGLFAGTLGKARGHVLRLATVLEHLQWCVVYGRPEPRCISVESVDAAARLMDRYFLPMAERVFGDAAIPVSDLRAMALARYLHAQRLTRFNARTVRLQRINWMLREAGAMKDACSGLIEAGLIRPAPSTRPAGAPGRPSLDYEVHPALSERWQ
jgi:hypothetical protein